MEEAAVPVRKSWQAMIQPPSSIYDAVVMLRSISYVTGFGNEKPPSAFVKHGIRICRKTTHTHITNKNEYNLSLQRSRKKESEPRG